MNCDTPPAEPEGYRFVRRRGAGTFRSPERPAFANSGKSGQKRRQKPMVFGGVLFHISFAVERNMAAGGIHAGRGCSPQSENGKRAIGDAGPYGVRDRRHGEIRVGGVCPLGAFKRGTRERQRGQECRRFGAELFCTAVTIGRKGNPKTDGFWRRSFPYFFRC